MAALSSTSFTVTTVGCPDIAKAPIDINRLRSDWEEIDKYVSILMAQNIDQLTLRANEEVSHDFWYALQKCIAHERALKRSGGKGYDKDAEPQIVTPAPGVVKHVQAPLDVITTFPLKLVEMGSQAQLSGDTISGTRITNLAEVLIKITQLACLSFPFIIARNMSDRTLVNYIVIAGQLLKNSMKEQITKAKEAD